MLQPPYPTLDELLQMMGETGKRLAEIEACEGAAGNISICLHSNGRSAAWNVEPSARFPLTERIQLPMPVPELAGAVFLVSGSGRRLREIFDEPEAHVGCIVVEEGGTTGRLHTSPRRRFARVTSEFNSHLAAHYDQILASGTNFHALVHAQPPHITYLSHIPRYQYQDFLNRRLFRWQPETIIVLPEGVGLIPFCVPGSAELASRTVELLKKHRAVLWAKHGLMVRSDVSVKQAGDKIEYLEAAARYEYLNLIAGEPAEGLSAEEVLAVCRALNIEQRVF